MGKFQNVSGQTFNYLTVLSREGNYKNGDPKWKCLCSCGNITYSRLYSLKNNIVMSCGCLKAKVGQEIQDKIIGKKFYRLTIIKRLPNYYCECKCDCGKICHIRCGSVVSGHAKSCGCLLKEYINNKKAVDGKSKRNRYENKTWKRKILIRDNFQCYICKSNNKLIAHHLNGWNKFPRQRLDINNGITLCSLCHDDFHDIYGRGNNTKVQFNKYLKDRQICTL